MATPDLQCSQMEDSQGSQQPPVVLHYSISEEDIDRIARRTKELMQLDVEQLVTKRVDEAVSEAVKGFENTISTLVSDNKKLQEETMSLNSKLDDLEQYSRRQCPRVSGIPETSAKVDDNEATGSKEGDKEQAVFREDTDAIVLAIAKRIQADVSPNDIDRSHRVGRPTNGKCREIIVKFTNYHARQRFITKRKLLRDADDDIFINEDLTMLR